MEYDLILFYIEWCLIIGMAMWCANPWHIREEWKESIAEMREARDAFLGRRKTAEILNPVATPYFVDGQPSIGTDPPDLSEFTSI